MAFRHQLPVWSPLTLGALGAGLHPSAESLAAVELRIREEYGAAAVVLTGSGTIALALAYLASAPAPIRPRIALPAWACPDLLTAADAVNAEVVLYDLDPGTLGPDLDSLRTALRSGPNAVVVAHWFGFPVDLRPIASLVRSAGAQLIDDAAQGVGASVAGRPVGAGGDFGVLSFGRGKGRTGGQGGALLAHSRESALRLEKISDRILPGRGSVLRFGSLFAQWAFGRPWIYGVPMRVPALKLGQTVYHPAPELRRMDQSAAAVLSKVWEFSSTEEVATRRRNAERWREGLKKILPEVTMFDESAESRAGWLRFPVKVPDECVSIFRNLRMVRRGVSAGYPSLLRDLVPRNSQLIGSLEGFPGGSLLSRNLFALPVHRRVRGADFRDVLDVCNRCSTVRPLNNRV